MHIDEIIEERCFGSSNKTVYVCCTSRPIWAWEGKLGLAVTMQDAGVSGAGLVGQIRRSLSTTFVRAQVQCLLSRMDCIGKGVIQAAKRRQWAAKEDERMRRERQAQWLGRVRGTNLVRKGQFFLL